MAQTSAANAGPPYIPNVAGVGGRPTVSQDIPATAIFLLMYLTGAVANMAIFQLNRRKGHKFLISWAMFGFCMARVITCVLRLAWATRPSNPRLALADQIFTNAGIVVVYVVILLLCQRVLRATYPRLGWNRRLNKTLSVLYVILVFALLLVIAFTILSVYTLSTTLRSVAHWMQRGGILYMLIFNVVSVGVLLLSLLLPRAPDSEAFGSGTMRAKVTILEVAVFFGNFIAGFRTATAWAAARPASEPTWYDSKAAFYIIMFGFEIVVVYLFLFTRIDRRFWVPSGSQKPGDYSRPAELDSEGDAEVEKA
ncbi:hypothetical protein LTR36_006701 [Oleoguttula mirabilis]|uniref:Uncharacterized protein n=1 Tax=Oleoguttula mirabilis TaxID=1507867 RepID=A0AAV9JC01_9PEZI|nr:hypothetical protein LTR36_006701 [Oleoguttula mirabilis]